MKTPLKSLRAYCVDGCMVGQQVEVKLCPSTKCVLHAWRMGRRPPEGGAATKAISAKCLDCSGGNMADVRGCRISDCELFVYRRGKNPHLARKGSTPEVMAALRRQIRLDQSGVPAPPA